MHKDFQKILSQFKIQWGEIDGKARFNLWVRKRGLNVDKPYDETQIKKSKLGVHKIECVKDLESFKESFQWARPLIQLLKTNKDGKLYRVEAHFALTSMNSTIYTRQELLEAVHTLPGQPCNVNHILPDGLLEGVEIIGANFENECNECLVFVRNGVRDLKGRDFQNCLDNGLIDQVSIEVVAEDVTFKPDGKQLHKMRYVGLAFLDEDALPGIPLTRIMSVESVMERIFESLNVEGENDKDSVDDSNNLIEVKNFMDENSKVNEVSAVYCPLCGSKLVDEACPNEKCGGYKKTISLAEETKELRRKLADAVEQINVLTKENVKLETENKTYLRSSGEQAKKLASLQRENLSISVLTEEKDAVEKKNVELREENSMLRGRNQSLSKDRQKNEEIINSLEKRVNTLNDLKANLEAENEKLMREVNVESEKRAVAEQKALNETRVAAKAKTENAKTLEEKAADVRKISDLSTELSEKANALLKNEKEIEKLRCEVKKRDDIIIEKQQIIENAKIKEKRMHNILKKHSIYEVDKDGNLIIP